MLPADLKEELPKLLLVSQISETLKQPSTSPRFLPLTKRKISQKRPHSPGVLLLGKKLTSKQPTEDGRTANVKLRLPPNSERLFGSSSFADYPNSQRVLRSDLNREVASDNEDFIAIFRRDLAAKIRQSLVAAQGYFPKSGASVRLSS